MKRRATKARSPLSRIDFIPATYSIGGFRLNPSLLGRRKDCCPSAVVGYNFEFERLYETVEVTTTPAVRGRTTSEPCTGVSSSGGSSPVKQGHGYDRKLSRILHKAAEVFANKRCDGASIRDISTATGVSPSGLYYYFSSKEDLLFLIQRRCLEGLIRHVSNDLEGVEIPVDRLAAIVRNHLRFCGENPSEMKVLAHEGVGLSREHEQEIARLRQEYADITQACVRRLVPSVSETGHRIAAIALLGMLEGVQTWYPRNGELSVDEMGSILLDLFLDGARSPQASARTQGQPEPEVTSPAAWGPQ